MESLKKSKVGRESRTETDGIPQHCNIRSKFKENGAWSPCPDGIRPPLSGFIRRETVEDPATVDGDSLPRSPVVGALAPTLPVGPGVDAVGGGLALARTGHGDRWRGGQVGESVPRRLLLHG